jgi:hypothetical protein
MSHAVDVTCMGGCAQDGHTAYHSDNACVHLKHSLRSHTAMATTDHYCDSHCPEAPGPSWCRSCTTCEKCKVRSARHTQRVLCIMQNTFYGRARTCFRSPCQLGIQQCSWCELRRCQRWQPSCTMYRRGYGTSTSAAPRPYRIPSWWSMSKRSTQLPCIGTVKVVEESCMLMNHQ